jgi:hypothetical protein
MHRVWCWPLEYVAGRTRGQEAAAGAAGEAGGQVLVPRRRLQQPPLLHAVHPAAEARSSCRFALCYVLQMEVERHHQWA